MFLNRNFNVAFKEESMQAKTKMNKNGPRMNTSGKKMKLG